MNNTTATLSALLVALMTFSFLSNTSKRASAMKYTIRVFVITIVANFLIIFAGDIFKYSPQKEISLEF